MSKFTKASAKKILKELGFKECGENGRLVTSTKKNRLVAIPHKAVGFYFDWHYEILIIENDKVSPLPEWVKKELGRGEEDGNQLFIAVSEKYFNESIPLIKRLIEESKKD